MTSTMSAEPLAFLPADITHVATGLDDSVFALSSTASLTRLGLGADGGFLITTLQLDARNIPLATTFETVDDLVAAAKTLIQMNEQLLNHWYAKDLTERLVLWCYRPEGCEVRGRRKLERPSWHYEQSVMPPHPGFADVDADELEYVIGIFDRNAWTGEAKGFVTCYPSDREPGA